MNTNISSFSEPDEASRVAVKIGPFNEVNQEISPVHSDGNATAFAGIVGQSSGLRSVLQLVETVAATNATVLLMGETGTGKELIARAVHERSPRKKGALVTLNCAAIPGSLFESEFFGHERGAFTGAHMQRAGRLELADHGTLFLDEVGELPLELQPKLLRALQDRAYERVGSARTRKVDIRLVAATNRNLEEMVSANQFRSDLYYRLNVFPIRVPPLRERRQDIPLLVHHFTKEYARQMNKRIDTVPAATMEKLMNWYWPGNVRELQNVIERCVILADGNALHLQPGTLVTETLPSAPDGPSSVLKEKIEAALRETRGRVSGPEGAAVRLGLAPSTLESRIRALKIDKDRFR